MASRRVSRWQSRLACRWSVELLFPTIEEALLFSFRDDLPGGYQSVGFLWTWTFPDERGQYDVRYAMACWKKHATWLRDSGKRLVRSIERGGKSGQYHFHGVTDQRWDINEIRENATRCGFGRVNVKVVPRERVYYIAKYIGKPGRWTIPAGVRLWAAIGFQGVKMRDVRCKITSLTVTLKSVRPLVTSVIRWRFDGKITHERLVRADWNGDLAEIHEMNITKDQALKMGELLASGAMLALAEYRTCEARQMTFDEENKKTGEKTGKKVTRKLVEHGVEVGNQQVTVTEWLPDDSELSAVKAPAAKGEAVVVEIDGFSKRFGITAKSLKPIGLFAGKIA